MKKVYEVIIIGGGPAGLAAALSASQNGAKDILLIERNNSLGGILNQCIHNGFGLHYFNEELTGPEYASRFITEVAKNPIETISETMVLNISRDKTVYAINPKYGYLEIKAKAIVLAMGCRERARGAIGIPGARASGIFTAGAAQLYMNIEGLNVGKRIVILGSGDIGLIMARRLTLEGAKVLGVYEVMPYSGGLKRNIVQCLNDYDIPLYLSHTITNIKGKNRVEQVTIQKVDEQMRPIDGTQQTIDCDTILLSVGLIPENELTRQAGIEIDKRTNGAVVYENMETSMAGVFACGNVCHVHDLVDFVTTESMKAGKAAAEYAQKGDVSSQKTIEIKNGSGVGYTVPQKVRLDNIDKGVDVFFRTRAIYKESLVEVKSGENVIASFKRRNLAPGEMEKINIPKAALEKSAGEITVSINGNMILADDSATKTRVENADGTVDLICIVCPSGCRIKIDTKNGYKVTGNTCPRGEAYGKKELISPTRVLTSTAIIKGAPISRVSVKTNKDIPKSSIFAVMKTLDNLELKAPVKIGDTVVSKVEGLEADFVVTKPLP